MKTKCRQRPVRKRCRFTLIEMLVVVAVILIIAALLLPALGQAIARARYADCSEQLHQFAISLNIYRSENDDKLPLWLSHLYPQDQSSKELYVCDADKFGGREGGRPPWLYDKITEICGAPPDGTPEEYEFNEADDTKFNPYDVTDPEIAYARNPQIEFCSYFYEFNASTSAGDWGKSCSNECKTVDGMTFNEVKYLQLKYGCGSDVDMVGNCPKGQSFCNPVRDFQPEYFPVIRCYHHWDAMGGNRERILNLSYAGNTFESMLYWEYEKGVY